MIQVSTQPVIDEECVHTLVRDWFKAFNGRAPVEEILPFFTAEGLVIRLPEATLRSYDDIRQWWDARGRHPRRPVEVPEQVDVRITSPMHADVTMRVARQARTPGAGSSLVTWSLTARHGAPRIRTYLAHPLDAAARGAGQDHRPVKASSNETEDR